MITFMCPALGLLAVLPFLIATLLPPLKGVYGDALRVPFLNDFNHIAGEQSGFKFNEREKSRFTPAFWKLFVIWLLLTVAAMRPIWTGTPHRLQDRGRDIMLVTDISTSMLETDFVFQGRRLKRLDAVRAVVSDFVDRRQSDRLGLILFGTRAYLQAPLTYDRHSVQEILWSMDAGMAGNSTSIGDALGLALKNISAEKPGSRNKVIILLTDGENNDGSLSFPEAVDLARREDVKVYTIGVGGQGFNLVTAFFGIQNQSLDEKSLKELAAQTKGRYFRADDLKSLTDVYRAIDDLEPEDQLQNLVYPRRELYYLPLLAAFLLTMIGLWRLRGAVR